MIVLLLSDGLFMKSESSKNIFQVRNFTFNSLISSLNRTCWSRSSKHDYLALRQVSFDTSGSAIHSQKSRFLLIFLTSLYFVNVLLSENPFFVMYPRIFNCILLILSKSVFVPMFLKNSSLPTCYGYSFEEIFSLFLTRKTSIS